MKIEILKYIRQEIREAILWNVFRIALFFSPLVFIILLFLLYNEQPPLFIYMILIPFLLLVILVTIPRWKRYYHVQFEYARRLLGVLERNSSKLTSQLKDLDQIQLPKEVYWLNLKIIPDSFKIQLEIHTTRHFAWPAELEKLAHDLEQLIMVNESTIFGLKKQGWDAEENIELSLKVIVMWVSRCWEQVLAEKTQLRSTISIGGRGGFFNMAKNKWEGRSFFQIISVW